MKAIVTVGLPGSGKSTFAAGLAPEVVERNMDAMRELVSGDPTNQAATAKAIWHRNRLLERLAREGRDVILSDTHAKRRDRTKTIKQLRLLGYTVQLVFFDVGEAECLARNARRDRPVPEEAIVKMARLLRGTPPLPAEADEWAAHAHPEDRLLDPNDHTAG